MGMSSRTCPQCGNSLASVETMCDICKTQYIEPNRRAASANLRRTSLKRSTDEQAQLAALPSASYGNTLSSSQVQRNVTPLAVDAQSTPLPEKCNDDAIAIVSLDDGTTDEKRPLGPISLPGFTQSGVSRKRLRLFFIVASVILMLVLLGGSMYAFSRNSRSAGSVAVYSSQNQTTSVIKPTPSPVPLFADNFADDSKGWSVGSGQGFSSTITHNVLVLSEKNHRVLDITIPGSNNTPASYSDFSVTVAFTLSKADQNDSVGLFVRGASTSGNFSQGYFVDIYGDSSYDVFKVFAEANKDTFLVDPTPSSFINPVGQQNKLTVDMKGPKMVIIINGKVLTSLSDNDYTSGEIALFVENGKSSAGVQASFSNVLVNPAPNQLPGQ